MANCLVVGANGFIGSYLTDQLAEAGHHVTAFDRYSRGVQAWVAPGVERFAGDFLNTGELADAIRGQHYVFHFLSLTSPATATSDPALDVRTNVLQTIELLRAATEAGVKRLYYASSGGAIYGDQQRDRFSEEDRTLPLSPYAIGKLTIENYLRFFRVSEGLQSVALRISNPFGPRQPANNRQGLIPIALRQILLGEPVTEFDDGRMIRDFIYVEDLVEAIVRTVGRPMDHDIYNIGSGTGRSVREVLDCLRDVSGVDFLTTAETAPATFLERVVLDTARFETEFGAIRETDFRAGVMETLEFVRHEIALQSYLAGEASAEDLTAAVPPHRA